MPIPLIPCRHKQTGALAEIPESALYLFADFERIDEAEQPGDEPEQPADEPGSEPAESTDTPSKQASTGRTSKAATSAKKTEEH
jgi:hypothetical protein